MSDKKMVDFTTFSKVIPVAVKTAFKFSMTWVVSSLREFKTSSPLDGFKAICPETYSVFPASTAWLYGPIGAGALSVLIIVFMKIHLIIKFKNNYACMM